MDSHPHHSHSSTTDPEMHVGPLPKNEALSLYFSLQTKGLMPYMIEENSGEFRVGYSA
jgi:hypothetical protein